MARFLLRAPLSRRTFLRGAGTALALPWLEAMLPRAAFARGLLSAPAPRRFAFLFAPNGKRMDQWTPAEEGPVDSLPPLLEPLAPWRRQLLVLTGLSHAHANANGDGPGDHARSAACFLTGVQARKTEGANLRNGVSVDQLLAEKIGVETRLPSLELGTEPALTSGNCDSGYSCAYSCNVSWKTPSTPVLKEVDPRLVFERLFGSDDATPEVRAKRLARRRSILDAAGADARRLRSELGATDRRKVDEYLESVRSVEREIEKSEAAGAVAPPLARPSGVPADLGDHLRLLASLLVAAWQADLTRVASFMFANDGSNRSFPFLGVPDGHHETSHHGNDPVKLEKLAKINRFHVEQLAFLLGKLAATEDGDGTLLDHALVTYGCGISDGNAHNHDHLPIVVAGGGGLATGRHVRFAGDTPLCNLFLALLERGGVRAASFGDSTGRLAGI
jgi:hypothetical protein